MEGALELDGSLDDIGEPLELKEEVLTPEEARDRLFASCKSGNVEDVRAMLSAGASVAARDGKGWSPLLWASFHGHANVRWPAYACFGVLRGVLRDFGWRP